MTLVGRVTELWCYPVKSMRGHSLAQTGLDEHGLVADRRYAFSSTSAAIGAPMVHSRERVRMLRYQPSLREPFTVTSPGGESFPLRSDALIQHLESSIAEPGSRFRLDYDPAPFTDVRPISLVSTATVRAISEEFGEPLDPQRFRSNIILQLEDDIPFAEDAWAGRTLQFGNAARLSILERIPRCSVVGLNPDTSEFKRSILTLIAHRHESRLGIYARVQSPDVIRVGDPVFLD